MIVRIVSKGTSFAGLSSYLTHDPKANTDERVAWAQTLNCASDDVPSAVKEMQRTAQDAELLKQEAGIRAGGRSTENCVKHVSLNWSPDDDPSREHMVATAEDFLQHMKWHEHQTVMVAHDDKEYAHVHLMINTVHPETGLKLDDNFERRRAQEWALDYERENGNIHCEQRLKDVRDREDAPTRDAWMAFQENKREFERVENAQRELAEKSAAAENNAKITNIDEWKILKDLQREEREGFFAEGKSEFSNLRHSICAETRENFRETWAQYHADRRADLDATTLGEIKQKIMTEQRETLDGHRKEAFAELRMSRDEQYQVMLDDQRQTRQELRGRQEEGWDNTRFLEELRQPEDAPQRSSAFQEAASDVTQRVNVLDRSHEFDHASNDNGYVEKHGGSLTSEIGIRAGLGAMSIFDSVFRAVSFTEAESGPSCEERSQINTEASAATARREQTEREVADEEWRRRQARGE